MTVIDETILRAYDIRGIVDHDLTEATVKLLGQAIGSVAASHGQNRVVVGYDGRTSSPRLAAALQAGLMAAGRTVIDIGEVPTPLVYFATYHLNTGAGIAITGSHNPSNYNGLKTIINHSPFWGEAIKDLGRRIREGDLVDGAGQIESIDVRPAYRDQIQQDIKLNRPLKVVIDCGNGVPGGLAPELIESLGAMVVPLYCEVNGQFPNHHPDPSLPENLQDLIATVKAQSADVGIAFDGDGDRLGVVDERGHIIWADRQMMLYAREVLRKRPGEAVIFDVKCSGALATVIEQAGGQPLMWKTGHSLIKEKLRETKAPLAGEMSGHLFFNDRWYGFDDALYAAARLLEILAADTRPASQIFAELPEPLTTPEIRLDLKEGEPRLLMTAIMQAAASEQDHAKVTTLDGLRVDYPDGWGLVRASNTQPCLVMRFEGQNKAALERIRAHFQHLIQQAARQEKISI